MYLFDHTLLVCDIYTMSKLLN